MQPPKHTRRTVVLKLEAIGDSYEARYRGFLRQVDDISPGSSWDMGKGFSRRPWVAEITGTDDRYGLRRVFIKGSKDHSEADSIGTRGVYYYYHLRDGGIYQVRHFTSWKCERKFFCRVEEGSIREVEMDEVLDRLRIAVEIDTWMQSQQQGVSDV